MNISRRSLVILFTISVATTIGFNHSGFPDKNPTTSVASVFPKPAKPLSGNRQGLLNSPGPSTVPNHEQRFVTDSTDVVANFNARSTGSGYDFYTPATLRALAGNGDALALEKLARQVSYTDPLMAIEYDFTALVHGNARAARHAARIYRLLGTGRILQSGGIAGEKTPASVPGRTTAARGDLVNAYAWALVAQLHGDAASAAFNTALQRLVMLAPEEIETACKMANGIDAQVKSKRRKLNFTRPPDPFLASTDLASAGAECGGLLGEVNYTCRYRFPGESRVTLDAFACKSRSRF